MAEQGTAFAEPSGPFEVAAQEETYLPEPFRLVPPLELELVVDPALDPHGKPWSVHVERSVDPAAPLTEEVFDGKASEEGIAKVAGQRRGMIEAEKGKARLDIEVPDTRIFGRVLAPSGQPEPAAMVSVLESDGASQILPADDSGHFELRGVAPGEVSLVAETRQGDFDADPVVLSVGKEAEIGPIDLKLQKKTRFVGWVLTSRGGGGGAAVTVMGVRPARLGNDRTRTSADGRFEVRLPSGVESAVALVAALGSSLTAFELRPGPSTDLPVTDLGGTVEVALGVPIARQIAEEEAFLMLSERPRNSTERPIGLVAFPRRVFRGRGAPTLSGARTRWLLGLPGTHLRVSRSRADRLVARPRGGVPLGNALAGRNVAAGAGRGFLRPSIAAGRPGLRSVGTFRDRLPQLGSRLPEEM